MSDCPTAETSNKFGQMNKKVSSNKFFRIVVVRTLLRWLEFSSMNNTLVVILRYKADIYLLPLKYENTCYILSSLSVHERKLHTYGEKTDLTINRLPLNAHTLRGIMYTQHCIK